MICPRVTTLVLTICAVIFWAVSYGTQGWIKDEECYNGFFVHRCHSYGNPDPNDKFYWSAGAVVHGLGGASLFVSCILTFLIYLRRFTGNVWLIIIHVCHFIAGKCMATVVGMTFNEAKIFSFGYSFYFGVISCILVYVTWFAFCTTVNLEDTPPSSDTIESNLPYSKY